MVLTQTRPQMTETEIPVIGRPDERTARIAYGLHRRDEATLAELHRDYGRAVMNFIRRATGDPATAEDLHQEIFLEIWRRGPSYRPERAALGTWIMLIARSRTIDHLRKRIPEPRDPSDPVSAAVFDREDLSSSPEAFVERWQMATLLERLPDEEAQLLRMRFHEELSQNEIADRTGVPLGTVKTRMVRALRRLRDMIDEEGGR
jgi:RNA polymerase sigma-70 factor (ECF subfamily)